MNDFAELLALCPSGLHSAKYTNLRNYVKRITDYLELVIDIHQSDYEHHKVLSDELRARCSESYEAHKMIKIGKLLLAEHHIKETAEYIRNTDRLSKD
jgi:hypothetical protein